MQSLTEIVNEAIGEYMEGRITYLLSDPVINVFRIIFDQKNELQRLKAETLNHVWASEEAGKPVLVPLDDAFARIQQQISAVERKITVNEKVADELDKAFHELQVEPPLAVLNEHIRGIREEIERKNRELNIKLVPYRAAAEMAHADFDKIPEVIQAREETAVQTVAMESEAAEIEEKLARIHEILLGVVR